MLTSFTPEKTEREKETENKPEQVLGAGIIGKMHLLLPHFAAVTVTAAVTAGRVDEGR